MKVQLEIDLEDVFEGVLRDGTSLEESFTRIVKAGVLSEMREKFKEDIMKEISDPVSERIGEIAKDASMELIREAENGEYEFTVGYSKKRMTVKEYVLTKMQEYINNQINNMVKKKAEDFVKEAQKRYDMAFAAFIVDNMKKQNLLKDERLAELLKDNN